MVHLTLFQHLPQYRVKAPRSNPHSEYNTKLPWTQKRGLILCPTEWTFRNGAPIVSRNEMNFTYKFGHPRPIRAAELLGSIHAECQCQVPWLRFGLPISAVGHGGSNPTGRGMRSADTRCGYFIFYNVSGIVCACVCTRTEQIYTLPAG